MALLGSLRAQTPLPEVGEVVPQVLYLEAGGKQVNSILRGSNLQLLRQVHVTRQGKVVAAVYVQIGPAADTRRTVSFIASPECTLAGDYQVQAVAQDDSVIPVPLSFVVVKAGDPRASLPDTATLAETARTQTGQRIVIAEPLAPVITSTLPDPLIVSPNGITQKILLRGKNLRDITEVRVRKSDGPVRYKGSQGIPPFRKLPEGIEVEVTAGKNTAMDSKFVLDLMVKKYLAASVPMTVGEPPPPPPADTVKPAEETNVITLIPGPEKARNSNGD